MKALSLLFVSAFCLFFHFSSKAQSNYAAQWKKVEDLVYKKNLPQSALSEVKKIYTQAKKEGQDAQLIKALVFITELQNNTRENSATLSIAEIENEIKTAKEPARSILQSMLAGMYWNFLQQNRWKFYDRTNTVNFEKNDIATWTLDDLHHKISGLYLSSIQNESILKTTQLSRFEPIIIKGNVRHLRPTLFDLLAHRALDYFRNDERDLTKPAYAFEISQEAAFSPAPLFAGFNFTTRDSLSLHHKALLVYQNLIRFHLKDSRPDALLDVDISRLQFVYNNSVHPEKDSLYLQALQQLISNYTGIPAIKQAQFLLAQWYDNQATNYFQNKDSSFRYLRVKAREILVPVVKDSTIKNEGWTNSFNLLKQIETSAFSFEVEKVNLPFLPFRSLVEYRNLPALNFRIIRVDAALERKLEERKEEDDLWKSLVTARSLRQWKQSLPSTNDYQPHHVEIKIDSLPPGEYYLLASSDAQFNYRQNATGARKFYVSDISYLNNRKDYFVLHRQTGQPLAGAKATVFTYDYDYKTSRYRKNIAGVYTTDPTGYFKINDQQEEHYRVYYVDIVHGKDSLKMDDPNYDYYYYDPYREPNKEKNIFFFLDRSIYRPGQTVYFKGIAVHPGNEQNEIMAGNASTIYLLDANHQPVDSMQLTTNEFGSFHGKFQLPAGTLNGQFQLEVKNAGTARFRVEDYKRPRFYVEFEKISQGFKAGDTIHLTGNAKAYAGNNIDKGTVSWRVVRQPRFLYTWFFPRWWMPPTQPLETAHGRSVTDAEGKFQIKFTAIPDKTIDPKYDPLFDYRIYADVTDLNGETRSGEQLVTAGYKSLLLKVQLPERLPIDSLRQIQLTTENMSGVFQPAILNLRISKLQPEQRLIRQRYWQQPDQFLFSKEEYLRYFPHDEYKDETDPKTWESKEILAWTDSSRINGKLNLSTNGITPGFYALEITTSDKDGKEVKDIRFVELYEPGRNAFNKPEYLWVMGNSKAIEPGESTTIKIGSSAPDVFLVQQTLRPKYPESKPQRDRIREPIEDETTLNFDRISQEKKTYTFQATEKDRGGYGVAFFFVKHNRFYLFNDQITVPWTNKELNIEYASFRDKTLPGNEEKWKVKISGSNKDQLAAEMLVSMYDASLDQFTPHQWNKPHIWPYFKGQSVWLGRTNFDAVRSEHRWLEPTQRIFEKSYDQLYLSLYDMRHRDIRFMHLQKAEGAFRMSAPAAPVGNQDMAMNEANLTGTTAADTTSLSSEESQQTFINNTPVQIRRNFNETAFFFPDLRTDGEGNIEFSFTTPEALTRWKIQTLAHTKDLAFGYDLREMITQKDLMVQPNFPRYLRQGDKIELPVKISNITDLEATGQVELLLFDAVTMQPVDGWFLNTFPNQYFTVAANSSEVVKFPITVPAQFSSGLTLRVVARSGNTSDGEENILPVLSNKLLVTESMPLPLKGYETKNFQFEKLLQSGNSPTLQHQALTVEYTSNPAWYAIQALPYLMEYPYDCAEQIWNRYYANAVASKIANSIPRIRAIFERWKTIDTAALLSNLQKNQELKSALLEETPWVLQAKSESEQKRNIALLFDLVKLSAEMETNLAKLKDMQSSNGGFVWFRGGPDDHFVTQYIVTGIGRLKKMGIDTRELSSILNKAIPYLDKKLAEEYDQLIKRKVDLKKQYPAHMQVQYLYMRSFFPETRMTAASTKAYEYFLGQAVAGWPKQHPFMQGMLAIALQRTGKHQANARMIISSLKENSIYHEELGRYWKDQRYGYSWFWWYAPIETQALMIEAFDEVSKDINTVNELRTWLIRHKQTNNWRTTKATADAIYALLLKGSDWLGNEPVVTIQLGTTTVSSQNQSAEAGTGYFKQTIAGERVKPEMGNVTVNVKAGNSSTAGTTAPSWGAVYWQYFEDLDKVTSASTPLRLNKKLFVETNTDRGPVLNPLLNGNELKVGDKITVRIELRVDRDMEYVHMKDLRAASLEPIQVLSGYRWQGGLGYYESTRDAATHFFFNYLPKGTYVFEYSLFVNHAGDFSNGITTIESMYAPEFRAHSEGQMLRISQ